jgi:hypothetical protein
LVSAINAIFLRDAELRQTGKRIGLHKRAKHPVHAAHRPVFDTDPATFALKITFVTLIQ